jgi:photosystem II stability/assembly factor-like uncharacterized protein
MGELYNSQDGGYNWSCRTPPRLTSEFLAVQTMCPISTQECWLLTSYAHKDIRGLHTVDGGRTWKERCRFLARDGNIASENVCFVDSNNGWVTISEFHKGRDASRIHRTTDGGSHWSEHLIECTHPLIQCAFLNNQTGWIVEPRPTRDRSRYVTVIHSSTDGGITWRSSAKLNGRARSLYIKEAEVLFLCGKHGFLASSYDQAKTWAIRSPLTSLSLESIHFKGTTGIAVGHSDSIRSRRSTVFLLTRDSGQSWIRVASPVQAPLFRVYLKSWQTGIVASAEDLFAFQILT